MKKIMSIILALLFLTTLTGCNTEEKPLPLPEVSDGVRGDLGVDKNINEANIDDYLNRDDAIYRDMRMLIDKAEYENIGGDSYLSGFVKGFEVVPLPYLCNVDGLPEEVGTTYNGPTLFTKSDDGTYIANYEESMDILESLFPKDKVIFLMCGGGGYAGMTKNLLVGLGWDETKIYNVGGYWYYKGKNNVEVKYEKDGETKYNFSIVNYHDIVFDSLTKINDSGNHSGPIDDKIEESDFVRINSLDELNELENSKTTFPLFVFLSGCPTCAEFFPIVKEFSENSNVKMYSVDLNDIWGKDNSITSRIDYAPSMFIYKDGDVVAYLSPSSDEDHPMYLSEKRLTEWVKSNINIDEFEKEIAE